MKSFAVKIFSLTKRLAKSVRRLRLGLVAGKDAAAKPDEKELEVDFRIEFMQHYGGFYGFRLDGAA